MLSTKLSRLNWARIRTILEDELPQLHIGKDFAYINDVKQYSMDPDILPAILHLIGTRFVPVRNETGKYSFDKTAAMLMSTPVTWDGTTKTSEISQNELRGILMFLKISPRGSITKVKQSGAGGRKINALVPLILSAWKQHQGIGYMEWDWSEDYTMRRKLLDYDMLELSEYFFKPEVWDVWTNDELAVFRAATCVVGTTGETKAPESVTTVSKVNDPVFKPFPKLLKHVLMETWIAAPAFYHPMQIQNLIDLDSNRMSKYGDADIFADEMPVRSKGIKRANTSGEPVDLF